jgi:hypothetical protein
MPTYISGMPKPPDEEPANPLHVLRGQRIEEFSEVELLELHDELCEGISEHGDQPEDHAKLMELDMVSEELERRNESI